MGLGFGYLLTLDPWLGPLWATCILDYLNGCEVAPYATTPPPPPRDPSTPWTGQDPWYPRPDMTLVDYCAQIFGSLVQDKDTTDGMIAAYHLNHPIIVAELKVIAAGGMIKLLERLRLPLHTRLKAYWGEVQRQFPYVTHVLAQKYNLLAFVTTSLEGMFTILSNQQFANNMTTTTSAGVAYQANVHLKIKERLEQELKAEYDERVRSREERVVAEGLDPDHVELIRRPVRHSRAKGHVHKLLDRIYTAAEALPSGASACDTSGSLKQQKHADARKVTVPQAQAAMKANTKTGRGMLNGQRLFDVTLRHTRAQQSGDSAFVEEAVSAEHTRAWGFKKDDAVDYLSRCDKTILCTRFEDVDFSEKGLRAIHLKPMNNDPLEYICLCDLLEYHLTKGGADPPVVAAGEGGAGVECSHHERACKYSVSDARAYLFACDKTILSTNPAFQHIDWTKKTALNSILLKTKTTDPEGTVTLHSMLEYYFANSPQVGEE